MVDWLFDRCGRHFILVMMLVTRGFCLVGGALVIYYVDLTIRMSQDAYEEFALVAGILILISTILTVVLAVWETRMLRGVLVDLAEGRPVDTRRAKRAGADAVLFAGRHHRRESIMVPATTVVPLCVYLWVVGAAPVSLLMQVMIAGFLGISAVLMLTFFSSERWMARVTQHLVDHSVPVPFEALPASRILVRMTICFGLAIAVTALMIGGLAYERTKDIQRTRDPVKVDEAVSSLRYHTILISLTAVATGLVLSRLLANSIASRVDQLVEAMKRVQAGSFVERVKPTGNDEIDILARQFNAMVQQLDQNDHTIRDLNVGLEHKVTLRTRQLSKSKRSLQRSLKKLREYDQLKTTFFSNISHELRTPLTMIISPVDRIIETHGPDIPARVGSLMEVVRVNANRLLELINQLLEFSKLEAGRAKLSPSAVDLNALARDLVSAAQPLAEQRGVVLRTKLDTRLPLIAADAEKIETVLRNLLSNALKFTPAGGVVEIESQSHEQHAQMAVTDTGIGISREDYGRVFERFVQIDGSASRQYSGTGLGLALVKEFVELHGGEIHLDSEVGLGSRFWFTLPLTSLVANAAEPVQPAARPAKTHRFAELMTVDEPAPKSEAASTVPADAPHVLIADDTPEMRSLIAEILADHYHVATVADGAEAWEAVQKRLPDLILSDVMMPHVDGYELCRRIKENPATAAIPFVMLTAKADLTMKIEGLNRGADDYLVKPFSPEELRARVGSLLRLKNLHSELEKRNGELQTTLAELRSTQAQLIQSEKMSSLGQLVAGLAHEINNAINAVYNGIQPLHARSKRLEGMVAQALAAPADENISEVRLEIATSFRKISTLADVIENGASRTARIVKDLRTFSHPGSEAHELFDLNQSLEMCLNLLSSQMKGRITVRTDYGEFGLIRGPSGQLNQVFMNILNNAQQAIAGAGEITIATRREAGRASVAIRDTGCGMSDEVRQRIFDPFYTTKGPGVGTGLGLSLSYGIIAGLGGTIECHSQVGFGSEFVVTFPCDDAPANSRSSVHETSPPAVRPAAIPVEVSAE